MCSILGPCGLVMALNTAQASSPKSKMINQVPSRILKGCPGWNLRTLLLQSLPGPPCSRRVFTLSHCSSYFSLSLLHTKSSRMTTEPRKGFDNKSAAQNQGIPVSGMLLTDTKILEHRKCWWSREIGLEDWKAPPSEVPSARQSQAESGWRCFRVFPMVSGFESPQSPVSKFIFSREFLFS